MLHKLIAKAAMAATLTVAAVSVTATSAVAQSGNVSFTGSVDLFNDPLDNTNSTLYIDFLSPMLGGRGTLNTVVGSTSGVFDAPFVATASVSDLRVTPTTTSLVSSPLMTYGGYTFTNVTFLQANAANYTSTYGSIGLRETTVGAASNVSAEINLFGTLTDNAGFSTQFTGVFTTQFANTTLTQLLTDVNSPGGIRNQGVSASFGYTTSVVPEPSTYALMAAGLAGLALVARRRRSA